MNILISVAIFLSSFSAYTQEESNQQLLDRRAKAEKIIKTCDTLREEGKVLSKGLNDLSKENKAWLKDVNDASKEAEDVSKMMKDGERKMELMAYLGLSWEYRKTHKGYTFFKLDRTPVPIFKEYNGVEQLTVDFQDPANWLKFVLFCPKDLTITPITTTAWFIIARQSDDVQAFFPAKIASKKTLLINGTSYIEYIIGIDSI